MSRDRFDVLERFAPLIETPEPSFERFLRRRDRKRRNQRIAAAVVGIGVFVAPVAFLARLISSDRAERPGALGREVPEASGVDYLIDLNSGVMTPLPDAIIQSLGKPRVGAQASDPPGQYATAPDGSRLAYVGTGDEGNFQIFVANIDGTGVHQVTHAPNGASSPAWSPDGTSIAYVGYRGENFGNIFVLELSTGESTQVTGGSSDPFELQFTPDGTSIIYTDGPGPNDTVVWSVPVTGGKSTVLVGKGEGVVSPGNASLSPDGRLVTFLGGGWPRSSPGVHCGPCRFLANADGTNRRIIPGWISNPAGTWAPDGRRIVCLGTGGSRVIVVDIATGDATPVAEGHMAIWLDDHSLLVEV